MTVYKVRFFFISTSSPLFCDFIFFFFLVQPSSGSFLAAKQGLEFLMLMLMRLFSHSKPTWYPETRVKTQDYKVLKAASSAVSASVYSFLSISMFSYQTEC